MSKKIEEHRECMPQLFASLFLQIKSQFIENNTYLHSTRMKEKAISNPILESQIFHLILLLPSFHYLLSISLYSPPNDLTTHTSLCNIDQAFLSQTIDLGSQLILHVFASFPTSQSITSDDSGGMDLVLYQFVGSL